MVAELLPHESDFSMNQVRPFEGFQGNPLVQGFRGVIQLRALIITYTFLGCSLLYMINMA